MRSKSLYWHQFLLTAGMVALAMTVLAVSFLALSYNYSLSEKRSTMKKDVAMISELSRAYFAGGDITGYGTLNFRQLASYLADLSGDDVLICQTDGTVLLSSDEHLVGKSVSLPESIVYEVLTNGTYSGMTDLGNLYHHREFIICMPVVNQYDGEITGIVAMVSDSTDLTEMWRAFAGIFFFTALTVLLTAVVACSMVTAQQTKPLQDIAKAARRFAGGNFDQRVVKSGSIDEIDELADSFNAMADSLQRTELQRREFIANVSHELKTPMTTIGGYTDGILDGTIPPEKANQYLQTISDETKRLARLVRRMLDISRLQASDVIRDKKRFDICESMRCAIISMEKKIMDRGLDVAAEIPDEPVWVLGDPDLITQVIYNLLENAAKFAPQGSTLKLALGTRGGKALVAIQNQGDTIAPEELPLLFERFHKSDKSRSEDKDGVGLGLYIVKTILNQHREEIRVTSENGVTTFTFTVTMTK
ncbi:HAMP domain-containing histidine kinase [bacterium 210917-DFI.7.65]|nr:HAMP domain-containing histidine kinase [bacterium 210917-DFI.7.65]